MSFMRKFRPDECVEEVPLHKRRLPLRKYGRALLDPKLYLEHWRCNLAATESRLAAKRVEFQEQRVLMEKQWDDLRAQEIDLQNTFSSFNKFLIDNSGKRERTEQNIELNRKMYELRAKECEKLVEKIENLKEAKVELDENIRRYSLYEKYMNQVLDVPIEDNFLSADGIIARYGYYTEIAQKLGRRQETIFVLLQNAKSDLDRFIDKNESILLALHTRVAGLQGVYEHSFRRTRQLESLTANIRKHILRKYIDFSYARKAIWNLYLIMCHTRTERPKIRAQDFENQLVFISRAMRGYRKLRMVMEKSSR